jgi:hypothetical protein
MIKCPGALDKMIADFERLHVNKKYKGKSKSCWAKNP